MTAIVRRTAGAALAALVLAGAAAAAPLQSAAALARGLAGTGRAEATLRYLVPTPSGASRAVHAVLALEPPDRARIDVPATGEKLAVRADGGEWLQPGTKQLLRFAPRQATAALRWWRVLLGAGGAAERRARDGHWVLTLLDERGRAADSAEVWLDARGYPARLQVPAGDPEATVYRLNGWRFGRPRGPAGFRIAPPPGVETVDMP